MTITALYTMQFAYLQAEVAAFLLEWLVDDYSHACH